MIKHLSPSGKCTGSSNVGFVSRLESFHIQNDISNHPFFAKRSNPKNKNYVKILILSRWFDGLDTGSKDEEYGKVFFLFNWKLSWFLINDDNSDSLYSLSKIILDLSPVFFGLVEARHSQPGSGALPKKPGA